MAKLPKKEEELNAHHTDAYRLPDGVTLNVCTCVLAFGFDLARRVNVYALMIVCVLDTTSSRLTNGFNPNRSAPSGSARPRSSSGRSSSGARKRVRTATVVYTYTITAHSSLVSFAYPAHTYMYKHKWTDKRT